MKVFGILFVLFLLFVLFIPCHQVWADRGGFSPRQERVSESGQKAVIAWNGTHEILMLSTDVNSSRKSEVIELMPLPSNPRISKGEIASFLKAKNLVNTYFAVAGPILRVGQPKAPGISPFIVVHPKIKITFQEAIGVHFLTVLEVEEADGLVEWLEGFLEAKGYTGDLPSSLEELCSYYIENEMKFFVVDVIEANSTVKTVDPLVYEFNSSRLYYPLRISSLFSGETEISLFTITSNNLNEASIIGEGFVKKAQFQIKLEALGEINSNMTELFSSNPYMCYFRFEGSLQDFDSDILASLRWGPSIPTITLGALTSGSGGVFLFLFLPVNKIGRLLRGKHSISHN